MGPVAEARAVSRIRILRNNDAMLRGAFIFFAVLLALGAQQQPRPKFEVAAIKESKTGAHNGGGYSSPGALYRAQNVPLHFLISRAYNVKTFQVTGGPPWVESVAWDIDAKGTGNPPREQLLLMLQSLLEERFQLQLRRQTADHSVYLLSIAKSGSRLTPADCTADGASCDNWSSNNNDVKGDGVTMQDLADALAEALEMPVVDKTGIQGRFNLHLHWTPQSDDGADVSSGSIFTVIQEQLGVRLESGKAPVDMLVI